MKSALFTANWQFHRSIRWTCIWVDVERVYISRVVVPSMCVVCAWACDDWNVLQAHCVKVKRKAYFSFMWVSLLDGVTQVESIIFTLISLSHAIMFTLVRLSRAGRVDCLYFCLPSHREDQHCRWTLLLTLRQWWYLSIYTATHTLVIETVSNCPLIAQQSLQLTDAANSNQSF